MSIVQYEAGQGHHTCRDDMYIDQCIEAGYWGPRIKPNFLTTVDWPEPEEDGEDDPYDRDTIYGCMHTECMTGDIVILIFSSRRVDLFTRECIHTIHATHNG